jgi:polysaccharide export outer membrane protein
MLKKIANKIVIGMFASLLCAFVSAQEASSIKAPALRIAPGDLIELSIYENADLSGHFRVNENGNVSVPLAGAVHVAGNTAEEAAVAIEKRYIETEILQPANAHATVYISEFATQKITVTGEVRAPGIYPALGVRMLNDVMTVAGGLLPTASTEIQIAHRDDPEHPVKVEYDPYAHKPVIPQLQLQPGDTVIVPKAGVVYVVGAVSRQSGIVMEAHYPLTAIRAVSQAGPDKHGAKLKNVLLLRDGEGGKKNVSILNMQKIFKGEANDVELKDGDILYVTHSFIGEITPQVISTAIGFASSVAMYKVSYR